jgi:hypothetical protein
VSFAADWEASFVETAGSTLDLVAPPDGWGSAPRDRVARVVFREGEYPKIELSEPVADWSDYRALVFTVFNPGSQGGVLAVSPGFHTLTVDLVEVERAPLGRALDMSAIASLSFFLVEPAEPVTLYFGDVRLERAGLDSPGEWPLCAGLVSDTQPHPMTPLARPARLGAVVDPEFGTTIRRISDVSASEGDSAIVKPMYSTMPAWSADEAFLILWHRGVGRATTMHSPSCFATR